jgi:16S rRNA (cytosine967-C5)-methyltransferase
MTAAVTARDLVTKHVARRARRFPQLEPMTLDVSALHAEHARDAALVTAIDHIVARRWLTLAAVIRSRLDRPWGAIDADVKAPLLVGAAQILFMDRVPDHAAINEAVESTKRGAQPKAAGLVNAVLRRVGGLRDERVEGHDPERRDELPLADGGALRLRENVLAEDPARRLAEQTSCGPPLLEQWRRRCGDDETARLARHGLVHAPIIVSGLSEPGPGCTPHAEAGFFVHEGAREDLEALLAGDEQARVQDPAAAAAVAATADLEASIIVDACAGKGTKTRQLLELHPAATIVATDVDPHRHEILRQSFAGEERVQVVQPDGLRPWAGRADLLLLDVPCSNTGVLARRVEAKYRFDAEALRSLVALQRSIIESTKALLAPGGHLLYTTCSIEPAENEEQAHWAAGHFGLALEHSAGRRPTGLPGDPPTAYSDGGFYALLRN